MKRLALAIAMSVGLMPASAPAQTPPLKLVAFGTSLTERGGWQGALSAELGACLGRSVTIATVARSGETSQWALRNVSAVAELRPDVVLIEFHANDGALNRWITPRRSRLNMALLLDRLRLALPDARIMVMAMNPAHGMHGAVRPFMPSYVEAHRAAAAERGIEFVDHGPAWAGLGEGGLAAAIPDGLHPRPEAAAAVMVPELVRRLAAGSAGCGGGSADGREVAR